MQEAAAIPGLKERTQGWGKDLGRGTTPAPQNPRLKLKYH